MVITSNQAKELNNINIILVGNPNVGKSTIFNKLTKQNQHTGNWSGKTVSLAEGKHKYKEHTINIVDLPGTYSLVSDSKEEQVTTDYVNSSMYDVVILVVNSTSLERNLLLTLQVLSRTHKAVLCLNMTDEAIKRKIYIDIDELELQLGIPVVCTTASKNQNIANLINTAVKVARNEKKTFALTKLKNISEQNYSHKEETVTLNAIAKNIADLCIKSNHNQYTSREKTLDKLFTSKLTGIPIMILLLVFIFWLTAVAANYPSDFLSEVFTKTINTTNNTLTTAGVSKTIVSILTDGIMTTVGCVISVMLPPAVIFFILFAIIEESGYLPRIAFNLDKIFKKCGTNGKLSLTMLMGLGCNACGVMGCRIIKSENEQRVAAITNSFTPCNGRIPTLITITTIFFAGQIRNFRASVIIAITLSCLLILSFVVTLITSHFISKHSNNSSNCLLLELPRYRKPKFTNVIITTLKNKVLYVLSRAIIVSIPAGIIIWILTNVHLADRLIIDYISNFLSPIGNAIGLDGVILAAFILGFPANEIVLPIILMIYSKSGTITQTAGIVELKEILTLNGWTITTALCFLIFTLFHFPCSTTCFAIYKETKSIKSTIASIIVPLSIGLCLCGFVNIIMKLIL